MAASATSPIVGKYLKRIGRKNAIIIGMFLVSVATAINGFLIYFDD
jgi:MFS family permease